MAELLEASGWAVSLLEAGTLPIAGTDLAPEGVLPDVLVAPVNALLLRGHGRAILVDAGSGPFIEVWPGATDNLPSLLEAEGATPDLIIVTHLDFDHAGGLVVAGGPGGLEPAFPACPSSLRRRLLPTHATRWTGAPPPV